jgi:hypothetical protein
VALFSQDLQKLQELEERYRQELSDYQTELTKYQTLREANPNAPDLATRYEELERKNAAAQKTYAELEGLRRALSPGSGASSAFS